MGMEGGKVSLDTAYLYQQLGNTLNEWPPEVRAGLGKPINADRRTLRKKLAAEYRRRGWPGHPPFIKPDGYVTVKEAHKRHPHIPAYWFISVAANGRIPAVKDTLKWWIDLGAAIKLRKGLFDDAKGMNNDAPDRITKKGIVYVRTTVIGATNSERAFLVRCWGDGRVEGFKKQYRRHCVYVDEGRAFVLLQEHRERRTISLGNESRKREIVALLSQRGEMHIEGIRQALNLKRTQSYNLLKSVVSSGRVARVRPGWYRARV
jgi:hypothetical protein